MLHLRHYDTTGLLEQGLVTPRGVQPGQFSRYAVVFTHPQRVHYHQLDLLVNSRVACKIRPFEYTDGYIRLRLTVNKVSISLNSNEEIAL